MHTPIKLASYWLKSAKLTSYWLKPAEPDSYWLKLAEPDSYWLRPADLALFFQIDLLHPVTVQKLVFAITTLSHCLTLFPPPTSRGLN
jgi:hypothetical protein